MTCKILDHDTLKIIYRSAVRPKKSSTPNHRLAPHGGEVSASSDPSEDKISSGSPLGSPEGSSPKQKAPTVFIRSRDEEITSGSKPMPTFDDTFLSMFRLCSCGTKPQRSENHHFVMTSSWEPQCHHDIIMRTPRIMGKLKFSWSGGL